MNEPIQPIPVDTSLDPAKLSLGKKLFNDPRFSKDNSLSCASCHHLESGGDDDMEKGITLDGGKNNVNTPTVFNARFNFRQHWDGEATSLSEQVDLALRNHREGGSDWNELLAKLAQDKTITARFKSIYRDGLTRENYLDALNQYEKSLITPNSRFDQYLMGNSSVITDDEKQGYRLFKDLGCITCHQGVNVGGNLFQKFGIFYDYFSERGDIENADYGRINVTNKEADKFVFKVPSLRNIEVTGPYLHDGNAATLHDAVKIMGKTQLGKTIADADIELLIKFMNTLTGEYNGESLSEKTGLNASLTAVPSGKQE